MPKALADGRILLTALTTPPKDIKNIKLEDIKAGKKISCRILKSDYQLGASGSDTVEETELCKIGKGQAAGLTTYEGQLTIFRYLDNAGKAVQDEDFAFELFKAKGTELVLVEREGPEESKEWAEGDEYSAYLVTTDAMQKPSDRTSGYIKRTVPLKVSDAAEDRKIVA